MPVINIMMLEGRSEAQKREVIEGITDLVSKSLDVERSHVIIHMMEFSKNNIALGGVPFSELK